MLCRFNMVEATTAAICGFFAGKPIVDVPNRRTKERERRQQRAATRILICKKCGGPRRKHQQRCDQCDTIICPGCGKAYVRNENRGSRFCSVQCYGMTRRKDKRAPQRRNRELAQRFLAILMERHDGICGLCGLRVVPDAPRWSALQPSVDHIIPVSRGGTDALSNLRLAHLFCNISRSNKDIAPGQFKLPPALLVAAEALDL